MRELKRLPRSAPRPRLLRRTPPGVRELKLIRHREGRSLLLRRTPPGVRELKRLWSELN